MSDQDRGLATLVIVRKKGMNHSSDRELTVFGVLSIYLHAVICLCSDGTWCLQVNGVSSDGKPYSYLTSVTVSLEEGGQNSQHKTTEPFTFMGRISNTTTTSSMIFDITLGFQGHYGEPPLRVTLPIPQGSPQFKVTVVLCYDPKTGRWWIEGQGRERGGVEVVSEGTTACM